MSETRTAEVAMSDGERLRLWSKTNDRIVIAFKNQIMVLVIVIGAERLSDVLHIPDVCDRQLRQHTGNHNRPH